MTTEKRIPSNSISLDEIEAIVSQARAYRAEITRETVGKLLGQVAVLFKRLAAHLRPSQKHLPQSGAWA